MFQLGAKSWLETELKLIVYHCKQQLNDNTKQ